jgi:HlyD family secretion protein
MTATVDFEVQTAEDVLMVPNAALRFRPTPEMLAAAGMQGAAGSTRSGESASVRPQSAQRQVPSDGESAAPGRPSTPMATIWRVDDAGNLVTTRVSTGISDGIVTQIEGPGIREGMQLIAGVMQNGEGGAANPFQQQPQQNRRGGF